MMIEYRFTFDPQFMGDADPFVSGPVRSKELAEGQLDIVANYTILLHETGLMQDYANYGFLEFRENGGAWQEINEDE
jgi:hypothetical protein